METALSHSTQRVDVCIDLRKLERIAHMLFPSEVDISDGTYQLISSSNICLKNNLVNFNFDSVGSCFRIFAPQGFPQGHCSANRHHVPSCRDYGWLISQIYRHLNSVDGSGPSVYKLLQRLLMNRYSYDVGDHGLSFEWKHDFGVYRREPRFDLPWGC